MSFISLLYIIMFIIKLDNSSKFISEFQDSSRADDFSYEGLEMLYSHLGESEEFEEFDPVSISCDWSEYKNLDVLLDDYSGNTLSKLEDMTTVLKTSVWSYIILAV